MNGTATQRRPQRADARYCECTGKRCYDSKAHARRAMRSLQARLRAYRCDHGCGDWHLTKDAERAGAFPGGRADTDERRSMISLIAAMTPSRGIGLANTIPWKHTEDLQRFKRITMGHPIVMGRKTHESIGRALPGRTNIVVTRNAAYSAPGCMLVASVDAGLEAAQALDARVFVIGGGELYEQTIDRAQWLYLTLLDDEHECDSFFHDYVARGFDAEMLDARERGAGPYTFAMMAKRAVAA